MCRGVAFREDVAVATRTCWSCGTRAHMTRSSAPSVIPDDVDQDGDPLTWLAQALYSCDECGVMAIGLGVYEWHPDSEELQRFDPDRWQPKRVQGRAFQDVPEHIAGAASEAHECHSIEAYRAVGALARAVVEATAKDKGCTKGNLQQKINDLHGKV